MVEILWRKRWNAWRCSWRIPWCWRRRGCRPRGRSFSWGSWLDWLVKEELNIKFIEVVIYKKFVAINHLLVSLGLFFYYLLCIWQDGPNKLEEKPFLNFLAATAESPPFYFASCFIYLILRHQASISRLQSKAQTSFIVGLSIVRGKIQPSITDRENGADWIGASTTFQVMRYFRRLCHVAVLVYFVFVLPGGGGSFPEECHRTYPLFSDVVHLERPLHRARGKHVIASHACPWEHGIWKLSRSERCGVPPRTEIIIIMSNNCCSCRKKVLFKQVTQPSGPGDFFISSLISASVIRYRYKLLQERIFFIFWLR